jgi:hypothetical protein
MELNVHLRASDGEPLSDSTRYRHLESCLPSCHSPGYLICSSLSESVCICSHSGSLWSPSSGSTISLWDYLLPYFLPTKFVMASGIFRCYLGQQSFGSSVALCLLCFPCWFSHCLEDEETECTFCSMQRLSRQRWLAYGGCLSIFGISVTTPTPTVRQYRYYQYCAWPCKEWAYQAYWCWSFLHALQRAGSGGCSTVCAFRVQHNFFTKAQTKARHSF